MKDGYIFAFLFALFLWATVPDVLGVLMLGLLVWGVLSCFIPRLRI